MMEGERGREGGREGERGEGGREGGREREGGIVRGREREREGGIVRGRERGRERGIVRGRERGIGRGRDRERETDIRREKETIGSARLVCLLGSPSSTMFGAVEEEAWRKLDRIIPTCSSSEERTMSNGLRKL